MTTSLAVREKEEDCATVAQPLSDLVTNVDKCVEMDGEELGEYIERNWCPAVGHLPGLMHLVIEMQRKFNNLDRKKQVNGTYLTIRGFRSFKKWFASFTGKSERLGYYLLETEEQKHKRNADRRAEGGKRGRTVTLAVGTVAKIGDRRITLTQDLLDALCALLEAAPNKDEDEPEPPQPKKRKRRKLTYEESLVSLGDHTYQALHRDILSISQTHHKRAIKKLHMELNGQGPLTWNMMMRGENR